MKQDMSINEYLEKSRQLLSDATSNPRDTITKLQNLFSEFIRIRKAQGYALPKEEGRRKW